MVRSAIAQYHNDFIAAIFFASCFVLALFFPTNGFLQVLTTSFVFLFFLPYLYGLIFQNHSGGNFFTYPKSSMIFVVGFVFVLLVSLLSAFAFASFDLSALYVQNAFLKSGAHVFVINTFYYLPLFLLIFVFSQYVIDGLSADLGAIRSVFAWLMALVLVFVALSSLVVNIPAWYLIPVLLPLVLAWHAHREGVLWTVPVMMYVAKLSFDLLILY